MTISREIQRKLDKLAALEAGGVDNWSFYDDSLEEWRKEGAFEDLLEATVEHINDALVDTITHEYPAGARCGASYSVDADKEFEDILLNFKDKVLEIHRNS